MSLKARSTWWGICLALGVLCLALANGMAQQKQEQKPQDIPDAPSTSRPPQKFPSTPPAGTPEMPPPASSNPPSSDNPPVPQPELSSETPPPSSSSQDDTPPPPPPPMKITTVPAGGATKEEESSQEEIYKIVSNVNQVMIPVMVRDNAGHMVNGLLPKDFAVYEDGVKQRMNFFTSDPFALSAAVIVDLGMPDAAVQKVNQTFPALEGAFSQFDEVSLYTYSATVTKLADFHAVGKKLTAALEDLKAVRGRNNGAPVTGGPLGPQGPMINGRPMDPSAPIVYTPPKESHVLNDAILAAAMDLNRRDRTRRKVIFIISDGREYRSNASYRDVLKVLLTNGITVYAAGVEGAAIPGYSKLQKIHLPRLGTGDILPKYVSATGGGEVYTAFSRDSIESIYSHAMGDARNLYTLGYANRATPNSSYRQIEVKVALPDVRVYAKDGYYPLPPSR